MFIFNIFTYEQQADEPDAASAGTPGTTSTPEENAPVANNKTILVDGDETNNEPTADDVKADKDQATDDVGSPENYADFDIPEGVTIDDTLLEQVTPIFKELNLTQEQAQKLVSFQSEQVKANKEKDDTAHNELMNEWKTRTMNDKEIGGDNFDKNVQLAKKAIDEFGTGELKQLLVDHGVGNHPELVRFFVKVGQKLQEDNPESTAKPMTKEDSKLQARLNMY